MDRFLKPDKLCADPESPAAEKEYRRWLQTFHDFLTQVREPTEHGVDELSIILDAKTTEPFLAQDFVGF